MPEDLEELKERFARLLRDVSPTEIAEMEQRLIEEGMPEEEVKRLCDVHVAVFKDALDERVDPDSIPGHPVHTFRLENEALRQVVAEMEALLAGLEGEKGVDWGKLERTLKRLQEVENHYLRKEFQLFPYLEKHGITGPPKVMWATHDDIRALFKKVHNALVARDRDTVLAEGKLLLEAMSDMFYKEEKILFPMALETLSEGEWAEIREGELSIGYSLVTPGDDWQPSPEVLEELAGGAGAGEGREQLKLDTGVLTPEQLNLVLTHLPFDISFVDEKNKVRYYSQGKERIFPRSPGIIGRDVQNCHPPGSVDVVNKIVAAFKRVRKIRPNSGWKREAGSSISVTLPSGTRRVPTGSPGSGAGRRHTAAGRGGACSSGRDGVFSGACSRFAMQLLGGDYVGSQRREGILSLLAKSKKPVTGSYLARHFGVSRQVIVQDIALLRARGLDIVATAQGYIFGQAQKRSTATRRLACRHAPGETRSELLALVQAGCRVVDVIVEHPVRGNQGLLLLETEADVEDFIERYNNQEALLLSTLTGGVHLHTIEADDPAVSRM